MHYVGRTIGVLFALALLAMPAIAAAAEHKLVLQISDNDADKMNTVMNVAANVSRLYTARDDQVDIKVVAFNAGLHMLRPDTSPVAERIVNFAASMPNVEFQACNNTREAMAKKSGKDVPIYDFAEVVPAGVVSIIELDEQGYTIVRP